MHCKHEDRKLQVCNDQGVETNRASLPWRAHTLRLAHRKQSQ